MSPSYASRRRLLRLIARTPDGDHVSLALVTRASALSDVFFALLLTGLALIMDVDRLSAHPTAIPTTASFFVLSFLIVAVLWSMHSVLMADYFIPDAFSYTANFFFFVMLVDWVIAVQLRTRSEAPTQAVDVMPLMLAFGILALLFAKGTIMACVIHQRLTWKIYVGLKQIVYAAIATFLLGKILLPFRDATAQDETQVVVMAIGLCIAVGFYGDRTFSFLKTSTERRADRRSVLVGWILFALAIAVFGFYELITTGVSFKSGTSLLIAAGISVALIRVRRRFRLGPRR